MKLLRILALCWIVGLILWPTTLSANGDCPTGFVINAVSPYEIQMSWTPGGNTIATEIRAAYGRWPENITDGIEVYNGNSSSTTHWINTEFIGVDVYYRIWGIIAGGNCSTCYASGTVQGGIGVGTMSLGILAVIPIGLMALSMAWFRITGKDGWPIMVGAGLAWLALGAYGFASSVTAWDIYQIIGSVSIMMLVICILLSYQGSQAHNEAVIKSQTKVVIQPPRDFGERYNNFEKRSGLKSKSERRSESDARLNDKLRKRLG